MAIILVVANLGMTFSKHFCQGKAVESRINLMPKDLHCGMMDMNNTCDFPIKNDNHNKTHIDKIPCCENEYQTIQLTEDFIKEETPLPLNIDFALAFVFTALNLDLFPNSTQHSYTEYHSPPIEKDIQVFFQTFLI